MNSVSRRIVLTLVATAFAGAFGTAWALPAADLIKKGVSELRDNKPSQALATFSQAQKLDPNSPRPHYYIASALERMGNADSARAEYQTAIRMDPKYTEALTGLGNLLYKQGKTDAEKADGVAKLELAVKYDPKDPAALFSLGQAYLKQKRYEDAEKVFRKGTLLKTYRAQFLAGTALALEGKGQLKEAEEYKKAKEIDPQNPEYHYLYGRASVGMNEFNEGLRAFVEATNVDSMYAPAYLEAGRLFYRAKRYSDAVEKFQHYAQLKPEDPVGALELGRALSYSRNPADRSAAIGYLEQGRVLSPRDPDLLKTLCKLYSDQGEEGRDSATVICSAYEEVAGENLTAEEMLRIGTIYVTLGDTAKAVTLLTKAVEKDSTLAAAAKFQLGTLYFKAQNYAAAVPYFEQAVVADPQFVPAFLNLGLAKMQLKQRSEAIEYLRRAVALKPSDKATAVRANVWIGQILMQMEPDSLPVALQSFRDAAAMDSANGDAIRGAGLSLLLMDNCAEALQWLNRGTGVEPDHIQGHIWLAQGYLKCKDIPKAIGRTEPNQKVRDPAAAEAQLSPAVRYETVATRRPRAANREVR